MIDDSQSFQMSSYLGKSSVLKVVRAFRLFAPDRPFVEEVSNDNGSTARGSLAMLCRTDIEDFATLNQKTLFS